MDLRRIAHHYLDSLNSDSDFCLCGFGTWRAEV